MVPARASYRSRIPFVVVVASSIYASVLGISVAAETEQPATRWWRGNIHTHSLWSDGNDFPDMIADWYRQKGYNFLALSDHNVLSQGVRWMKHDDIVKRGYKDALEKYGKRFGVGKGDILLSWEIRMSPFSPLFLLSPNFMAIDEVEPLRHDPLPVLLRTPVVNFQ